MSAIILGTTDEVTACDRCGRTDLKKTVVLNLEGEIVHFGTECASKTLGQSAKEIRESVKVAQDQARAERMRKMNEEASAWETFCAPFGGIFEAVDHFGGFTEARQAYRVEAVS
jgi:hypothetical protein